MRQPSSCFQCRIKKRKCTSQSTADDRCDGCLRNGVQCSLADRLRFRTRAAIIPIHPVEEPDDSPSISTPSTTSTYEACISDECINDLVRCYFYYIHDRPHSLFHETTLLAAVKNRTISEALLYAICSLASSLSSHAEWRTYGPQLATKAKNLLLQDMESVCLANIQTCILLANVFAAELAPSSEALFFGIANRMAHICRLHITDPNDTDVLRETKARVWWTLVMADRWCSSGLGLPRQLQVQDGCVSIPVDEAVFQSLAPDAIPGILSHCRKGLWAYMISLADIFALIHDLNKSLVNDSLDQITSDRQVLSLAQSLDAWIATLPEHIQLNDANFASHQTRGLGGTFVALHLGYHHYCTLLYFQYLSASDVGESTGTKVLAERCKYHASAYSRLLAKSRSSEHCSAIYATVGHMTVVSSSVLLHTLLLGNDGELAEARHNLLSNFAALIELKKLWPSLGRTIGRLSTFQQACLCASDNQSHRIDRWMIRFLLEHSTPLEKRNGVVENDRIPLQNSPWASKRYNAEQSNWTGRQMADHAVANLFR